MSRYSQPEGSAGTFDMVLYSDPDRWPILARARKTLAYAQNTKVEWLIDQPGYDTCNLGHKHLKGPRAEYNYTMIFRRPSYVGDDRMAALADLLDDIEYQLQNGVRDLDNAHCYRLMGGVRDLLGRWPRKEDRLMLMILRDLTFNDLTPYLDRAEWIIELTLKAVKGSK